ncbi:MAG: family transcriptional regulator, cyclic receptor protein [Abditibacteriota bacterium]|nr:family transcriptional regulator, cyclic receptor protein [Abditibacteriota bacterium]
MSSAIDAMAVQKLNFFQELNEAEARLAAQNMEPLHIKAGEVLFRQGDQGAWVYLLVKGEIELRVRVPGQGKQNGEDRTLCFLYPPAMMGEMSLLLDEPRTATAVAKTDCEVWQISRAQFRHATESCDRWANQFLFVMSKILASRLSETNRKLVSLIAADQTAQAASNTTRVDELEQLRERLFTQWSF